MLFIGMNIIQCKICGFSGKSLTSHICRKHGITCHEYVSKFGGPIQPMSDEQKLKLSVINREKCKNPDYRKSMSDIQKNGASIFTTAHWINKGFTFSDAKKKVSDIQSKNAKKVKSTVSWMQKSFWMRKGMDEQSAEREISRRQSILSKRSPKFSGHKRSDESKRRISAALKLRIDVVGKGKWATHFGEFSGRSLIEIEVYNFIKTNIEPRLKANVQIGSFIVDMIRDDKIIEFNGDFWHANPKNYKATDVLRGVGGPDKIAKDIWEAESKRLDTLSDMGYDVLIVWESDWHNDRENTINKIKHFLYGNS